MGTIAHNNTISYIMTEDTHLAEYGSLTPEQEELINGRYIPSDEERIYYHAFRALPEWRPFCDNPAHEPHTVISTKQVYGYCCLECGRKWNRDMTPRN